MSLVTTPHTFATSEVVTAATLNTEIHDPFVGIQAAWTAYTPTLTNIGGTYTIQAAYLQIGKTVKVRVRFSSNGGTTYSAGTLGISAPVTPHADYTSGANGDWGVGSGIIQPVTKQGATVVFATTTSGVFNLFTDNVASGGLVTNTNPGTFGTASLISFTAVYEAA